MLWTRESYPKGRVGFGRRQTALPASRNVVFLDFCRSVSGRDAPNGCLRAGPENAAAESETGVRSGNNGMFRPRLTVSSGPQSARTLYRGNPSCANGHLALFVQNRVIVSVYRATVPIDRTCFFVAFTLPAIRIQHIYAELREKSIYNPLFIHSTHMIIFRGIFGLPAFARFRQ